MPDACAPPPGPAWWDLDYQVRYPIELGAAPAEYTVELELSDAAASALFTASAAGGDDVRIVHHGQVAIQLDRELVAFTDSKLVVRFKIVEAGGGYGGGDSTYHVYAGNPQPGGPPAELRAVYLFYEDFEGFDIGADGAPTFLPRPDTDWRVADDDGNKVYRLAGDQRRAAELVGLTPQDGVLEARCKYVGVTGAGTVGFAYRAAELDPAHTTSYAAIIYGSPHEAGVGTFSDATWDGFASWSSFDWVLGTWYELAVWFDGPTSRFYIDGLLQGEISTTSIDGVRLGLFGYAVDAYFDDVKLRKLTDPEPAAALGSEQRPCG